MAKITFEHALTKLEKITEELEDGNLSLEKSLKKFDEGITLVEFCSKTLEDAKAKVEILLEKRGQITKQPFDEEEYDGNQGLSK